MTEEIRFRSGSLELAGHLAMARGARQMRPGIVLCHGFPSSAGGGAGVLAGIPSLADRLAVAQGWVVLAAGARGCRPSQGDFSLDGWVQDIGAAATELRRHPEVEDVWLAGFGQGGALAICAAAVDPEVRGVIAFAPPADFDDWAAQPRRLLEFARRAGVVHDLSFPRNFDEWSAALRAVHVMQAAERLHPRPLMVVHGLADAEVPVFDARLLADAHPSAELRLISGASHDLLHDPRAIAILMGWMDRQWNLHRSRKPV